MTTSKGSEDDKPALTSDDVRLPNPPEFHGNRRTDSLTCSDWVALLREHLLMRKLSVNSAAAVHFACLFLRGPALTWKRKLSEDDKVPKNFDKFADLLEEAFTPIAEAVMARDRLKRLRQQGSCDKYCDLFRKQSLLVKNMSDVDKVELFVDNLYPSLRSAVRVALVEKAKDDLELAMRLVLLLDYEIKEDRSHRFPSHGQTQLSAMSASASAPVRKCFTCGSTEHLRAKCPKNRQAKKFNGSGGAGKGKAKESNS